MIIDELARNVIKTQFKAFDADTLEKAKNRIIDIIGCTIGGANAPGCPELKTLVRKWGGKKEASILIHGGKIPAGNAAMINSIMARSYDFGVLTPFIGEKPVWSHIEETTVPTAITTAEWQHASGKDLLTALILGDDLTTRISAASSYMPGSSWDSPGIVNKFGAVAIACKLMGLSERQLINAMGIVLNQLAGSFQAINEGAISFKFAQGASARDGIIAAELAANGWNGGKDPLMGKYGYFSLYCQKNDPDYLIKNLGIEFYGDDIYKPYPSCRFIHSSIDCALQMVQEHDIVPENIDKITINLAPMHYRSTLDNPFELGDFPQCNANFSLRYNVANALIRKCVKLEHLTDAFIRDPEVGQLARKITVVGNLPPEQIQSSELTVHMKGGQEYKVFVDVAKGHPLKKPFTKKDIEEKFRANVDFSQTISKVNSEKALEMINNLEDIDDIARVIKLLTI
ncbi:MAG: MmgE/PrpD family protein [Dehalococcoidales bacterium]|nr:MmgE/PrpD family protein [Dehalococcoidales bacterium]